MACPEEPEPEEPSSGTNDLTFTISNVTLPTAWEARGLAYNCKMAGHRITALDNETPEGLFTGRCEYCGDRIEMKRLPGAVTARRILALISLLAEEELDDLNSVMLEITSIKETLSAEDLALTQAKSLMDVVDALFEQRYTYG